LAVSHIYGSGFHCLNMVKMKDVNNSDIKDTGIASLIYHGGVGSYMYSVCLSMWPSVQDTWVSTSPDKPRQNCHCSIKGILKHIQLKLVLKYFPDLFVCAEVIRYIIFWPHGGDASFRNFSSSAQCGRFSLILWRLVKGSFFCVF